MRTYALIKEASDFKGKEKKMKKKRVWHLLSNRWNSAITEYTLSTMRSLALRGHSNLFSPLLDSPAQKRAESYNIKLEPFKNFSLFSIARLRKIAQEFQPDVIFVYEGTESFLLHFLPTLKVKPFIVRLRGRQLQEKNFRYPKIFKFSHINIDLVLAPGKHMLQELKTLIPQRPPSEYVIIGIDNDTYKPYETWIPVSQERPILLILGRLDPVKGHREFFPVFKQILDIWTSHTSLPKPRLHIIGQPENISVNMLKEALEKNKLILNEDIYLFPERVKDLSEKLSRTTLGIIPSLWSEEICRVAEEFLLCGTPICVSGVGALEDVLFAGAGISYKHTALSELALRLTKQIIDASQETNKIRKERANKASQLFSFKVMGEHLDKLLPP